MENRKNIKGRPYVIFYILCVVVVLFSIYSIGIEPNLISINIIPIENNGLYTLFHDKNVVQISDLHITSVGYREKKMIRMINQINPDILFITGDLLTGGKDEDLCIDVLCQIRKPLYGVWAVLGNTDRYTTNGENENNDRFVKKLNDLGIRVLENKSECLVINEKGGNLFIVGVEKSYLSRSRLEWILKDIPDSSPVIFLSHYPDIIEKSADALSINLEDTKDINALGWGWQDNDNFEGYNGIVRFEEDGQHTLRVQRREDGVSVEQICLVAVEDNNKYPDISLRDPMEDISDYYASINPYSKEMVVIKTEDISDSNIFGDWEIIQDSTANYNPVLKDVSTAKIFNESPHVIPENYFEVNFYAKSSIDYHVWVRMKADSNSNLNDSIYLQFNDSINQNGEPIYRIGEYSNHTLLSKIDLIVAGHTHGGQVRFPIFGTFNCVAGHKLKYDKGLFKTCGTKMYVNRGIGTTIFPMRFLCNPEITVFKFIKEEI